MQTRSLMVPAMDEEDSGEVPGGASLLSVPIRKKKDGRVEHGRERRRTEHLISYWETLKGDRRFPSRGDIDPSVIPDLWQHSFLARISPGGREMSFERFGPLMSDDSGLTGDQAAALSHSTGMLIEWIRSLSRETYELGRPVIDSDTFVAESQEILYRCAVVPLSDDQLSINYLFGLVGYLVRPKGL
jgi:PAS domain-containing protein